MGNVHRFVAESQPATCFIDRLTGEPHCFHFGPHALFFTRCCKRRRWAQYVRVQVYYDGLYAFCAEGHGCKA